MHPLPPRLPPPHLVELADVAITLPVALGHHARLGLHEGGAGRHVINADAEGREGRGTGG